MLLPHFLGFPGSSVVKDPPANAGDTSLIPRSGRSPGEGRRKWKRKWRRKWKPTLVNLTGESHWHRSLEGYSPLGCKRVRHDSATKQQQPYFTEREAKAQRSLITCPEPQGYNRQSHCYLCEGTGLWAFILLIEDVITLRHCLESVGSFLLSLQIFLGIKQHETKAHLIMSLFSALME